MGVGCVAFLLAFRGGTSAELVARPLFLEIVFTDWDWEFELLLPACNAVVLLSRIVLYAVRCLVGWWTIPHSRCLFTSLRDLSVITFP